MGGPRLRSSQLPCGWLSPFCSPRTGCSDEQGRRAWRLTDRVLERTQVRDGDLAVELDERRMPLARSVALGAVAMESMALAGLELDLMATGARTVSWTTSGRDAVRKILAQALGPTGKQGGRKRAREAGGLRAPGMQRSESAAFDAALRQGAA